VAGRIAKAGGEQKRKKTQYVDAFFPVAAQCIPRDYGVYQLQTALTLLAASYA